MWKFIKDVYTISYFVTGWRSYVYTISYFELDVEVIRDVYTVSYFVTGCGSL